MLSPTHEPDPDTGLVTGYFTANVNISERIFVNLNNLEDNLYLEPVCGQGDPHRDRVVGGREKLVTSVSLDDEALT